MPEISPCFDEKDDGLRRFKLGKEQSLQVLPSIAPPMVKQFKRSARDASISTNSPSLHAFADAVDQLHLDGKAAALVGIRDWFTVEMHRGASAWTTLGGLT